MGFSDYLSFVLVAPLSPPPPPPPSVLVHFVFISFNAPSLAWYWLSFLTKRNVPVFDTGYFVEQGFIHHHHPPSRNVLFLFRFMHSRWPGIGCTVLVMLLDEEKCTCFFILGTSLSRDLWPPPSHNILFYFVSCTLVGLVLVVWYWSCFLTKCTCFRYRVVEEGFILPTPHLYPVNFSFYFVSCTLVGLVLLVRYRLRFLTKRGVPVFDTGHLVEGVFCCAR